MSLVTINEMFGGGLGIFTEYAHLLTSGGFGKLQALELQVLQQRFYKTKGVAEALNLSEHKARKFLIEKNVNYIKIGRAHYYRKTDIKKLKQDAENGCGANIIN